MFEAAIIADASPLIGLARIGQIDLLRQLARRVIVPSAVWREATARASAPGASEISACTWIEVLESPADPMLELPPQLGPGECGALRLARQLPGSLLLLDDALGRRTARALGFRLTGTVGLLRRAKQAGLIPAVRPHIDALIRNGLFIDHELIADVLRSVGES